jgi:hypothetical protein
LSACAARLSGRPMTARTSAAPTSTGGAPTARVIGSNRHPGAAARGGAEYLARGVPLGVRCGAERVVFRHRKADVNGARLNSSRNTGTCPITHRPTRAPNRPRPRPTSKRGPDPESHRDPRSAESHRDPRGKSMTVDEPPTWRRAPAGWSRHSAGDASWQSGSTWPFITAAGCPIPATVAAVCRPWARLGRNGGVSHRTRSARCLPR